jgi:hypothetical protein
LKHDADALAQLAQVGRWIIDGLPADDDASALDRFEAVDAAQHGAFARAGAADDGNNFAGLDVQ